MFTLVSKNSDLDGQTRKGKINVPHRTSRAIFSSDTHCQDVLYAEEYTLGVVGGISSCMVLFKLHACS